MSARPRLPEAQAPDDRAFFASLASPAIRALRAYDPGHDLVALREAFAPRVLIELGSNENPYGPSPKAREAAAAALGEMHRYPDPRGGALKRALAARHGVAPEQVSLGNGSHELLMHLAQVFAGPGVDVVLPQYGFAVFAIAARAAGANAVVVPALPADAAMPNGHDLDALLAAVTPDTRLLYLANPNNPTGTWYPAEAFERFIAAVPERTLVVVDEAYAECADAPDYASALSLLDRHRNLLVTRTFSKAYALAGLRVGCAIGHPELIALLERARESFNINGVALAAAEAALGDEAYLRDTLARNAEQRERLAAALRERGWPVSPSQTNFLLVEFGAATTAIEAALRADGVVLRPMGGYGLPGHLRISVGEEAENRGLLAALDRIADRAA
ncbi:histidinol-phosphate transaminase [Luteimonas aquatica]|uniref:histidinol-phosphate transaminase n=1 Tax=Luteimonas aquatica TaxID=450364 RepID=UPI001F5662AC|nr:histidinol-phosphate transaminase [Luteimonas aquatica]